MHGKELNKFCLPNSSDDLCLIFCMNPSSMVWMQIWPITCVTCVQAGQAGGLTAGIRCSYSPTSLSVFCNKIKSKKFLIWLCIVLKRIYFKLQRYILLYCMHGSNNLSSIKQKQLYALDEQNFKRKIVFYNSLCHDLTNCNRWDYSYSIAGRSLRWPAWSIWTRSWSSSTRLTVSYQISSST